MIEASTGGIIILVAGAFVIALLGMVLGIILFPIICALRATRTDGYDNTNLLNWLRPFSAIVIHPEDAPKYHYCDENGQSLGKVFYTSGDELSDVVNCRPPKGAV